MINTLFSSNNGNTVPGQSNISNILVPIPGKKIKSVEGFNFAINLGPNGGVTVIHPIITPTVLNEVYLLTVTYTLGIDTASASKGLNFVNYRLSFPPDPPGAQINLFIDWINEGVVDLNTKQFTDILCSEIQVQVNLPVPPISFMQLQAVGFKLILEDI